LIFVVANIRLAPWRWGSPRIPPTCVSISLHRVALTNAVGGGVVDERRISFQFRCIYFCRCEHPFSAAALGASQVSAVFRLTFFASGGGWWSKVSAVFRFSFDTLSFHVIKTLFALSAEAQ
jgi:hypothetical protein